MNKEKKSNKIIKTVGTVIKDIFAPPDYKALKEANKKFRNDKDEYKLVGLSGWLTFFQISSYITLAIIIYGFISLIPFLSYNSVLIYSILYIIVIGMYIFSFILLYKKKKIYPKFMIIILWCLPILALFDFFIGTYFLSLANQTPNEDELAKMMADVLRSVVYPIIWTLYFKKSVRVKNTFIK